MDKIIIIGGGASGLMLASLLPQKSAIIIEKNSYLGAKILISGGGKCNLTNQNIGSEFYLGNKKFIEHILRSFTNETLLEWFKKRGLEPILRANQYFCKTSSKELLNILIKEAKKQTIFLEEEVLDIDFKNNFVVKTDKKEYKALNVVVASGGLSYPKIGATKIGFDIASKFGHKIVKTAPALVGLTLQKEQFFFKELSGLSTFVHIKIKDIVFKGDLLFAHKGISGIIVLNISLYWEKGDIEIDFLPNFKIGTINSKKQVSTILPLPKRLSKSFLLQLGLEDKSFNLLSKIEKEKLKSLHHYSFSPSGNFGYSKAEVTKGGVFANELNGLESKKQKGLFFIGEVLDVTGEIGGYNFQWAFSSAYFCKESLIKKGNI